MIIFSDIGTGSATGTGNLSEDPLFADAAAGDYHLGTGSPCINAGAAAYAPPRDLEGTLRDLHPDMGAYEWTRTLRTFLPLALKQFGP